MESERQPLVSTHLVSAAYDEENKVLQIEFQDGSVYEYDDVPLDVGKGLFTAASPGNYFRGQIKGRYRFLRSE